ncbi:MAG: glycoside hydrolase family 57 protein [Ferroplasma sp.]
MSNNVILYFEVHQPRRLRPYRLEDINVNHDYFWDEKNKEIFLRAASKGYIRTTKLLLDSGIRASFSITGTLLEQAMEYDTKVIDAFDDYFRSGLGELLDETYYHSLASVFDLGEFEEQVIEHRNLVKKTFNIEPVSFRNTELIYNDSIAEKVASMGYKNILMEGAGKALKGKSPNYLYKTASGMNLLARNFQLSDDISFRFSNNSWAEYPLTADKYAGWIADTPGDMVNLFMDYETFGEHQWETTGIFEFLKYLPLEFKKKGIEFLNVRDSIKFHSNGVLNLDGTVSWADTERGLNPWLGNEMQKDAFNKLISFKNTSDKKTWRYLQTSDHLYYLSTGNPQDQAVHNYFNPYNSPYNAFLTYMNILEDFRYSSMK